METYIVYVKTDELGRITAVNSSAFLTDTEGWTRLDSGVGDKYHHAQGNYFEKPIMDERSVFRYKMENGLPAERTREEMDADAAPTHAAPSDGERITALEEQIDMLLSGVTADE